MSTPSTADLTPPRELHRGGRNNYQYTDMHRPNNGGAMVTVKPVSTMNILLSIAIVLQLYQIYTSQSTTNALQSTTYNPMDGGKSRASFFDSSRGLRGTSFLDPGDTMRTINNRVGNKYNDDGLVNMGYDPERGSMEEDNNNNNAASAMDEKERKRRQRNMILYGTEEGPAPQEPFVPTGDDDDLLNSNATNSEELPFQPAKYNYSQIPIRTKWTLPKEPLPATNDSNLAIIILSGRSNFERRQAIRETWGQNQSNIFFVIGGPEPDSLQEKGLKNPVFTSSRLLKEFDQYGDILDTIHPDTYKSLPYKVHYAIRWIASHDDMKHIQWILKADDDVVVRVNTLRYYVLRHFNPLSAMVIGRIEPKSRPHRTGKWAEDPKWAADEYPPWAYGSTGYVMSRPVFDYVASEQSLYYYQGEDASLGIWLYESPLDVSWMDSPDFSVRADQAWYNHQQSVVIGHDMSPQNMRTLYDKWKDPKVLDDMVHENHTNTKGHIFNIALQAPAPQFEQATLDDQFGMYNGYFDMGDSPWSEGNEEESDRRSDEGGGDGEGIMKQWAEG